LIRLCLWRAAIGLALSLTAAALSTRAQAAGCPQFFPGGQAPALMNPPLAQRTTMLCNDAYAVLASGLTRGPIWSAEHPTAASLATARETVREGQFHPDHRLPFADQSQLDDYRRRLRSRSHDTLG
jgi:endonuclease G